jgi:hypothetical protein
LFAEDTAGAPGGQDQQATAGQDQGQQEDGGKKEGEGEDDKGKGAAISGFMMIQKLELQTFVCWGTHASSNQCGSSIDAHSHLAVISVSQLSVAFQLLLSYRLSRHCL